MITRFTIHNFKRLQHAALELSSAADFIEPVWSRRGIYKRGYHGLADGLPVEQIDPEVTLQLDALVAAVALARPVQ